jgi:ATP-dependent helicase/DNAse subunit B
VDGELQSVGMADMARQKAPELRPLLILLASNLTELLKYQAELARAIHLRPLKTEHRFSIPLQNLQEPHPSHTIPENLLARVLIDGKIDRIDSIVGSAGGQDGLVIFDYKSSPKNHNENKMNAGIELQLIGYLLVADHLPELSPATALGAFYQPLKPEPLSSESSEDDDNSKTQRSNIMAKGILALRATDVAQELETLLGAKITQNGTHGERSPLKDLPVIQERKRAVAEVVQKLTGQIITGRMDPSPLRISGSQTACDNCDFKACCPFDRVTGKYRTLEKTKTLVNAGSAEK